MPRISDTKTTLLNTALRAIWSASYSSVTVDDICEQAGVKKGSFYHYFKSKAELAHAALDWSWEETRKELNEIFSPEHKPLERIKLYLTYLKKSQEDYLEETGRVLGCPYASIGSEQTCGNCELREKALSILKKIDAYTLSALREAQTVGELPQGVDVERLAQIFNLYYIGALVQARIQNDISPLTYLVKDAMHILGAENNSEQGRSAGR